MPWLTLLGNDIHYTDTGSGPDVVLLHGKGCCVGNWEPHISTLSNSFRVLAYDSVNHGWSSNSSRNCPEPDRLDELEAFIEAMNLVHPILIGQSMGAITALRSLVRRPGQIKAVIAAGMGWPQPAPTNRRRILDDESAVIAASPFSESWVEDHPVEYRRFQRVRSSSSTLEGIRHPRPTVVKNPTWDADDAWLAEGLRRANCPTLLFVGEQDPLLSAARDLHAFLPKSRLVVGKGAGHGAYFEQANMFLGASMEFLSRMQKDHT